MSTGQLSDTARAYFVQHRIQALLEEAMHDVLVALPDDPLAYLQTVLQRRTPLRLFVVGPPGAGKTTQCALLARKYGLRHLRVDDVLREVCAQHRDDDDVGRAIAGYVQRGAVVPDDLVAEAMLRAARAAEDDAEGNSAAPTTTTTTASLPCRGGWVFDAFPQQRAQAMYLQAHGLSPQKVLVLDVSDAQAMLRLTSTPSAAQDSQASSDTQTMHGTTDYSSTARTRHDIAASLRYYAARTDELRECYSAFYVRVDGAGDVAAVHDEVCEQIDALELPT